LSRKDQRLSELRSEIPEVDPPEALSRLEDGAVLVDVREPDEIAQGSPRDAVRIVRGYLELEIESAVPDLDQPVLTLCAGGVRSLFAAEALRRLGYSDVSSVRGGFGAWKRDGLPFETPRTLGPEQRERYGRHLLIPEVGEAGQLRLLDGRVLLVGAGGLGSPAALYLAAAGVGTLGIVDDDVVDRSNLQRQVLHRDADIGRPKVESARETLLALNPDIDVVPIAERITAQNVESVLSGYDVVVDGTDNFTARYLVNDACVRLRVPNVHAAIYRFEGQATVYAPHLGGPCYRCLYPEPPPPELAPSCAEAGVLGILPGVMGTLQAVEVVKLLLGRGEPLVGKLLTYDALNARFRMLKLARDPECRYCSDPDAFPGYEEVAAACATAAPTAEAPAATATGESA